MKIKYIVSAFFLIATSIYVLPFLTQAATTAQIQIQIDATKANIASTTAQISTFQIQVASTTAQITSLQTQVAAINLQIASFQTQVSSAGASIATLQQSLASLNSQLQTLNQQLASSTVVIPSPVVSTSTIATTSPYIYSVDTVSSPGYYSFKVGNLPVSKGGSWGLYLNNVFIKTIDSQSSSPSNLLIPNYIFCSYTTNQTVIVQLKSTTPISSTNQFSLTITSIPCSLSLTSQSGNETWVPVTTITYPRGAFLSRFFPGTTNITLSKDFNWVSSLPPTDGVSIALVPFAWVGPSILGTVSAGTTLSSGKASATWNVVGQSVQYDKDYKIVITDVNNPNFNATSTGSVKISTKAAQLPTQNIGLVASVWQGINNLLAGFFNK